MKYIHWAFQEKEMDGWILRGKNRGRKKKSRTVIMAIYVLAISAQFKLQLPTFKRKWNTFKLSKQSCATEHCGVRL